MYNTVNTIKWMAVVIKAENIVQCLTAFGDILSPIFKKQGILWTIKDEVDYESQYIKIMNYRFAGIYDNCISIPDELSGCMILRFTLQPLVENAIYHGLLNCSEGSICITVYESGGVIGIKVTDNGVGMDESRLNEVRQSLASGIDIYRHGENKIGLVNVNRRIKLHFGPSYGISILSKKGEGTEVDILMPKVQKS